MARRPSALERLARVVWEVREFDTFPDLFERLWQGVVAGVYRQGAAWIAAREASGEAGPPILRTRSGGRRQTMEGCPLQWCDE
ncbi:hypothetical protein GCM10009850_044740 [Nonomuraea monospora]|uniref:Transposase n=1 Tax=Nonomuraea monospora TaxID=568818 RepID=A0ABP5PD84_9ACTN